MIDCFLTRHVPLCLIEVPQAEARVRRPRHERRRGGWGEGGWEEVGTIHRARVA